MGIGFASSMLGSLIMLACWVHCKGQQWNFFMFSGLRLCLRRELCGVKCYNNEVNCLFTMEPDHLAVTIRLFNGHCRHI